MPVKPRIVVGVSAGIAAYKSCTMVSRLVAEGAEVRVVMSPDATRFVAPLTFRALTGQPVYCDMFDAGYELSHISLADWADLFIVAPATADIIARLAGGMADSLLAASFLAYSGKKAVAPAMNTGMWQSAPTKRNIEALKKDGVYVFAPDSGRLACGAVGAGRMVEPDVLAEAVLGMAAEATEKRVLSGLTALITAGATREHIDPVRYITNPSTGRAGIEVARALRNLGASVKLIIGPTNEMMPWNTEVFSVISAAEMYRVVMEQLPGCHIVVCSAAVGDFGMKKPFDSKLKKDDLPDSVLNESSPDGKGYELILTLNQNQDILRAIRQKLPEAVVVGYAAETGDLEKNSIRKLQEKGCDILIGNIAGYGRGFGDVKAEGCLFTAQGEKESVSGLDKKEIARILSGHIAKLVRGTSGS